MAQSLDWLTRSPECRNSPNLKVSHLPSGGLWSIVLHTAVLLTEQTKCWDAYTYRDIDMGAAYLLT